LRVRAAYDEWKIVIHEVSRRERVKVVVHKNVPNQATRERHEDWETP